MDDYISITHGDDVLVVRTSDWVVIATCDTQTFANQVLAGLNP